MLPLMKTTLLVLGGGPGGYVAAIRAGQLGIPTVLVEGQALGGTCLNVGCIPSKAMIHVAEHFHRASSQVGGSALGIRVAEPQLDIAQSVAWKDGIVDRLTTGVAALLKKHGVQVVHGWAEILDGKQVQVGEQRIQCEHLLLATGSETVELPVLPFGEAVVSSTEALAPSSLPEHVVVVGAGYIGLELGIAYRKLGVRVTVVEARDRLLPTYDAELTAPVAQSMKRLGIALHLAHSVEGYAHGHLQARSAQGATLSIAADRVLVAVGRRPRTEGFGLERLDLQRQGTAIAIDTHCQTSMHNVWAIGDVTGEPMLAHRAMAQGEVVAERIAGHAARYDPVAMPAVCFTDPELVVVGMTPEQADARQLGYKTAQFPFAANGRSMTLESSAGFVRVVARADNHVILGWQAVGVGVSELAAAFAQSLEMGARLEDIAGTVHAHPTLGEAVQEAALRALGRALHC